MTLPHVSSLEGHGLTPDVAALRVVWIHTQASLEALATLTPIRYPASVRETRLRDVYADSIRAHAMLNTSVLKFHEQQGGGVHATSLLAARDWETAYRLAIFRLERLTVEGARKFLRGEHDMPHSGGKMVRWLHVDMPVFGRDGIGGLLKRAAAENHLTMDRSGWIYRFWISPAHRAFRRSRRGVPGEGIGE